MIQRHLCHLLVLLTVAGCTGESSNASPATSKVEAPRPAAPRPEAPPAALVVTRCATQTLCLTPAVDALSACRAALATWQATKELGEPGTCSAVVHELRGDHPMVRRAAVISFTQPGLPSHYLVALASDAGYDRVQNPFVAYQIDYYRSLQVARLALERLAPDAPPALWLELGFEVESGSHETVWRNVRSDLALCPLDARGIPVCVLPIVLGLRQLENDKPSGADFSLEAHLGEGLLDVKPREGRVPRDVRPLLGRHTLTDLQAILQRESYRRLIY